MRLVNMPIVHAILALRAELIASSNSIGRGRERVHLRAGSEGRPGVVRGAHSFKRSEPCRLSRPPVSRSDGHRASVVEHVPSGREPANGWGRGRESGVSPVWPARNPVVGVVSVCGARRPEQPGLRREGSPRNSRRTPQSGREWDQRCLHTEDRLRLFGADPGGERWRIRRGRRAAGRGWLCGGRRVGWRWRGCGARTFLQVRWSSQRRMRPVNGPCRSAGVLRRRTSRAAAWWRRQMVTSGAPSGSPARHASRSGTSPVPGRGAEW